jgi:hypothetical protein
MRCSAGQRTAAILLAMLVQGALIAPYILQRRQKPAQAPNVPAMMFIMPVRTSDVATPPPRSNGRVANATVPPPVSLHRGALPEPRAALAITLPQAESPRVEPHIDWFNAMENVARDVTMEEAEQEERGLLLDSKPEVLQLPRAQAGVPPVVAERLGNGDLVTRHRVTDRLTVTCVHRQIPLSQHFEALARSGPPLCRMSGGSNAMDLNGAKPGYLKKPLPKPPANKAGK